MPLDFITIGPKIFYLTLEMVLDSTACLRHDDNSPSEGLCMHLSNLKKKNFICVWDNRNA